MDAISVVSDYVRLEKRGGRFWACCPFHGEKTASFTVNPDLKTYYCFGCHKGGTVINFVMEMDKMGFPETIELLAKRFGVELVYENSGGAGVSPEDDAKKKRKEELFELYQRISGTFHHFLLKKPEALAAKDYTISRGINIEMIERFGLGYAPADRYWLHRFLCKKGYSGDFLSYSGLFSSRNPRASLFSGRLMFPIRDRQGRTVAFGGRFLPSASNSGNEAPKYINSPELGIYKKGETLYAADLALPAIRKTKTAYIAEGYMDVIALHQAGITNAVAPLGTAFTEEQAKLLKRWAEKVILFFDSDDAGQTATIKGIYNCRKQGFNCAVVTQGDKNSQAKDPADILHQSGPASLLKRSNNHISDFDFMLRKAASVYGIDGTSETGPGEKARAAAFLFPYLDLLDSEIARASCVENIADAFGLLPALVFEDYRRHTPEEPGTAPAPKKSTETAADRKPNHPVRVNDELLLLTVVAVNYATQGAEKLFPKFRAVLEINDIEDANAREIFVALEECIRYEESGIQELLERISSKELRKFIMERSAAGEFSSNAEQLMNDGIKTIIGKRLKRQQEEIILKLRAAKKNSRSGNFQTDAEERTSQVKELLTEKMRIDEELYQLKQGTQAWRN